MTGTGTAADPYIVSSYTELEEAVSTSSDGSYIAFDPNATDKVIDMNEVYPEGCPTLNLRLRHLNGNGWTIRNLYVKSIWINLGDGNDNNNAIYNLSVESFRHESTSPFIRANFTNYYRDGQVIHDCSFSGITKASVFFYGTSWTPVCLKKCSFNIEYNGTSTFRLTNSCDSEINFENNVVKIVMRTGAIYSSGFLKQSGNVINNLFDITTIASESFKISSSSCNFTDNVIIGNHSGDITCSHSGQTGVSIFNSDTMPNVVSTDYLIGCTSAQLLDAAYLSSIGFSIGVD